MYWDVIEVKPEAGYCLFVRFKDGLSGRVRLRREELTGVLAPLLDTSFFEQVFIDHGAVAWPGEIDLAPDAMYAEVVGGPRESHHARNVGDGAEFRSRLPRFYELKDLLRDPSHPHAYFQNFESHLQENIWFATFALWERKLQRLDLVAWGSLKSKASPYLELKRRNSSDRGWQQMFDVLGEALAYNYLVESIGCSAARFLPESSNRAPDLEAVLDRGRILCEVKTINNSDDERRARRLPSSVRTVSDQLDSGFFSKLDSDIANAKNQLWSYDPSGEAQHLVYINVCFDNWPPFYNDDYFQQINQYLLTHRPGIKVVVTAGDAHIETLVVA